MSYQAVGSGGGIKQIEAKKVTFGATDKPLGDQELNETDSSNSPRSWAASFPSSMSAASSRARWCSTVRRLAKIFCGEITAWDDAAIKQLNPKVKLPSEAITVVHRSDGSGTTFNFTNYLSKVSEAWQSKIGFEVTIEWPVGVGAKGNAALRRDT